MHSRTARCITVSFHTLVVTLFLQLFSVLKLRKLVPLFKSGPFVLAVRAIQQRLSATGKQVM